MDKITDIVGSIDLTKDNSKSYVKYNERDMTPKDVEFIDKLFESLQSIFPAFKQSWPDKKIFMQAKREWMKAFIEADMIDSRNIQHGLRKARHSGERFLLSPGEFIEMCKISPQEMGLPTLKDAYDNVIKNYGEHKYNPELRVWLHPVVQRAAIDAQSSDLLSKERDQSLELFEYYYSIAVRQFIDGEMKPILKALPIDDKIEREKLDKCVKPEYKNVRNMDAIKALLGIKSANSKKSDAV